jgi:hypothetical protein
MDGCHGKEGALFIGQGEPWYWDKCPPSREFQNILTFSKFYLLLILEYSMENISLLLSGECSRGLPCISFNSDEN